MIDIKIETFLMVCKYMNYTRASEELHITQSAVSQQIAQLEDYYNTKLFSYNKRVLTLTETGIYLRNQMESLYNDSLKVKEVIENSLVYPSLRIGATLTIGNYYLPKYIIPYAKNTKAPFSIHIDDTKEILSLIDEGKIDIGLVEGIFNKDEYESKTIFNDDLVIVCNSNLDTSKIKKIEDLFKIPFITREKGSGTRGLFEIYLENKGYEINSFKKVYEINSIHILKEFLLNNYGITALYKTAVSDEINNGLLKVIEIDNYKIEHAYTAVWKKNSLFNKEYQHIINKLFK